jgi:ubiquinone/menaquinone biosynthesis C-methylase UbiE
LSLLSIETAKRSKRAYTASKVNDFYNEHFEDRHIHSYRYDVRAVLRREEIGRFISTLPIDTVIADLGCGSGDILSVLKETHNPIGMDFSFHSLLLTKKAASGTPLTNGSLYSLPFRDHSLGVALCLEVVEHLQHDHIALREIYRVLKPGGYLIISVPSNYYFKEYLDLMGHFRHYTRSGMVRLLEDAGLSVIEYLNYYPRTTRIYLYVYWTFVIINRVFGKVMHDKKTFFERPLFLSVFNRIIVPMFRNISRMDSSLHLGHLESNTFCVAQKALE